MTDPTTEPIRKSLLPCTPPPEWEFHTVLGARDQRSGTALFPGDTGPVVVRRLVTYGDWEPVRPNRWADEPPTDAAPAVVPSVGRAALRDRIRRAVCEAEGFAWDSDMLEPDEYGDVADAVLAVLPAPADRAAGVASFVLWLDASDGSVPTHDGVCWPDGAVTIHHRHHGFTTTHHSPEAACREVHGKQGRIVWPETAPADRAAVLTEAERTMLAYALDQAQEKIWSEDGFTDEDQAAVDSLRRLAGGSAPGTDTEADATLLAELQQHLADHTPSCNARVDHLMRRAAWALGAPRPEHVGGRVNAEDCPGCEGTNPPYPFICPGPETADGEASRG